MQRTIGFRGDGLSRGEAATQNSSDGTMQHYVSEDLTISSDLHGHEPCEARARLGHAVSVLGIPYGAPVFDFF